MSAPITYPEYQFLLVSVQNRVATLTLNRPDKRNALNYVLIEEMKDAFHRVDADPEVKVVVLKGSGDAFCAGADLEYLQRLQTYGLQENYADSTHLMELFQLMYRLKKVIVAQIEGHALAGGCGLATVCDFTYSVPEAKFGYTEVKIGFIPAIVMVFLLRKIGEGRAKELLLGGDLISAETAERYGLINRVIPREEMEAHIQAFTEKLCTQNSGGSMELTKRMIGDVQQMPLDDALRFASKMNAHARGTDECRSGIAAFLNKEKLIW